MMATYYVWRRSDGYVNCSVSSRAGFHPSNGRDTFDILLTTDSWPEAHALIEREWEDERHRALVASWNT